MGRCYNREGATTSTLVLCASKRKNNRSTAALEEGVCGAGGLLHFPGGVHACRELVTGACCGPWRAAPCGCRSDDLSERWGPGRAAGLGLPTEGRLITTNTTRGRWDWPEGRKRKEETQWEAFKCNIRSILLYFNLGRILMIVALHSPPPGNSTFWIILTFSWIIFFTLTLSRWIDSKLGEPASCPKSRSPCSYLKQLMLTAAFTFGNCETKVEKYHNFPLRLHIFPRSDAFIFNNTCVSVVVIMLGLPLCPCLQPLLTSPRLVYFWGTFLTCPSPPVHQMPSDFPHLSRPPDSHILQFTCLHSQIIPTCRHTCLSWYHQSFSVYNQLTSPSCCAQLLWICLLAVDLNLDIVTFFLPALPHCLHLGPQVYSSYTDCTPAYINISTNKTWVISKKNTIKCNFKRNTTYVWKKDGSLKQKCDFVNCVCTWSTESFPGMGPKCPSMRSFCSVFRELTHTRAWSYTVSCRDCSSRSATPSTYTHTHTHLWAITSSGNSLHPTIRLWLSLSLRPHLPPPRTLTSSRYSMSAVLYPSLSLCWMTLNLRLPMVSTTERPSEKNFTSRISNRHP